MDGKNIAIEYRYAEGRAERLPELVAELVRLKVNILLALGGDIALVLRRAATSIPIVVAMSTDPGIVEVAKQSPKSFAGLGENMVTIIGQDGQPLLGMSYTCLPDTIDPRGPKDSQR